MIEYKILYHEFFPNLGMFWKTFWIYLVASLSGYLPISFLNFINRKFTMLSYWRHLLKFFWMKKFYFKILLKFTIMYLYLDYFDTNSYARRNSRNLVFCQKFFPTWKSTLEKMPLLSKEKAHSSSLLISFLLTWWSFLLRQSIFICTVSFDSYPPDIKWNLSTRLIA